jgi:hypothetical protein
MCKECDAARKAIDKSDALAKKQAPSAPAAPPAAKPAAPAPAAKEAPKPAQPKEEDSGSIDFTPGKK